jgi:dolichol-phosphate mannosyltransferase
MSGASTEVAAARPQTGVARHPRAERPHLSVVIAAYNEQGNVPILARELHEALAAVPIEDYEIIFVDDGSTDATAAEVRAEIEKDGRVRLISLEKNSGLSSALEAGIRRAKSDVIVTMDGDLQADPRDMPRLLEALSRADCVCGYRANRKAGDGFVKRASSKIANAVRSAVLGDEVRDAGCTYRAFKRECLERVKLFRGMHRFLPTLLRYEGFTVTEVPVTNRPRRFGTSKYGVLNRVFAATYDLFAVRWMRSRVVKWRVRDEA